MAKQKLKIAQIGALWEKTPPKLYGGTERIVSSLTDELVKRGHQVTLFATGDSITKANLDSIVPRPLYRDGVPWENITYPLMHLHHAFSQKDKFDIFHMHLNIVSDYLALALVDLLKIPTVFTVHFRLADKDGPKKDRFAALNYFKKANFVTISNSQRSIRDLNYIGTVYNGINTEMYKFSKGGNKLFWLGRIADDKGTKEAIKVAVKLKIPIILAGKLDLQNKIYLKYYSKEIKPLLEKHKKLVKYIGEIDDNQKNAFFNQTKCLLNPLNWEEPFGLVPIEANACGVPVVAFARGAMPELIKDGLNGYLIKPGDISGMAKAVQKIYDMPEEEYQKMRLNCRRHVEENFTVGHMVDGYEKMYFKVLNKEK